MRTIQRFSALVGWIALLAIGVMYAFEAVGIVGDSWRVEIGQLFTDLADPAMEQWAAAIVGFVLAALAVVVFVAQLTPYRKTAKYHLLVDEYAEGETVLHSGAVQTALTSAVLAADGVTDVSVVVGRRRADARVALIDSASVTAATSSAARHLDSEFWSRLGIEPFPVDLRYAFQRGAARVVQSRRE